MKNCVMYSQKIRHYNRIFQATVDAYRAAVDFFISVCLGEWGTICVQPSSKLRMNLLEKMTHPTSGRPEVPYCFDTADPRFYKFPSYLRRAACMEAIGKAASYHSRLETWECTHEGGRPGLPVAGYAYPCLYRDNMYREGEGYTAQLKVYIRNTWDWITVTLRKSDVDYVVRHCGSMKQSSPTLRRRAGNGSWISCTKAK